MKCDKYYIFIVLLISITAVIVYINVSTLLEPEEPKKLYVLTEKEIYLNIFAKLYKSENEPTTEKQTTTTENRRHPNKVSKLEIEEVLSNPYYNMFYNNYEIKKMYLKRSTTNHIFEWKVALFKNYLKRFNKNYSSEEWDRRFGYFTQSLKEMMQQNRRTGARHGLTKFSDWSKEEFAKVMNNTSYRENGDCRTINFSCPIKTSSFNGDTFVSYLNKTIPPKHDWRDHENVIGPVLNQKQCNGCWAFGIVGVLEAMSVIQRGEPYTQRSIQELLDCSSETKGCKSGHVTSALHFLCEHNLGIVTEDIYPLLLVSETCEIHSRYISDNRKVKEFWTMCNISEDDILRRVAHHGPVIVVINAEPLKNYVEGVIQRSCFRSEDGNSIDHVVQIVGYNLESEIKYYIIKNSWGTDFGEDGYFRLEIGKNLCGVRDEVTYFDVKKK